MPPSPHFYAFWAINGALDRTRLHRQLDEFQRLGLDGVVFHPRFYPGIPPYLSDEYLAILDDTILHAKSLGMGFWIYDENGWPSGTADGLLYKNHPEDICQRLDLREEPSGQDLASFQDRGRTAYLGVQDVRGIDCYNPEATRHFLATVHERYRVGLSPEAFDHIEAFFTDEPESGVSWEPMPKVAGVPWSRRMPEFLRERFGRDATAQLPLLFTQGEGAGEFRRAYWELVTDLFCRGFLDPYREWCERHGKLFVGHVKGEEHPLFQLPMVGSCQRAYRHFGIPGIDSLERFPGNPFYPRQASSVARQFGNGRCMVEANGGAGWASSPEDLQRYLLWLARHGLTDFVLHLSQYQLDSAALYDWPPSQPLHVTWREAYPEILRTVRQEMLSSIPRDTLVVAPYRGIMEAYEPWELFKTNIHDGDNYPLTTAGKINARFLENIEVLHARNVAYDVTDERSFEESGASPDGVFHLGQGRYTSLLVSPDVELSEGGREILAQARRQGVRIVTELPANLEVTPPLPLPPKSPQLDLPWSSLIVPENAFQLEPCLIEKETYTASFTTPHLLAAESNLSIFFADPATGIEVNGHALSAITENDGYRALVPHHLLQPKNDVRFRSGVRSIRPFVWLKGHFLVLSQTPYLAGPNATVRTEGPFDLFPSAPLACESEFVAAGRPFAFQPVHAFVAIHLAAATSCLTFDFPSTPPDALHVSINNIVSGSIWGPEWTLKLAQPLAAGAYTIEVLGVPNGYNYYGPHHYYLGDGPVVSPDQIRGVRNFADPPDAPLETHVSAWHFKPWRLPARLTWSKTSA